MFYLMTPSTHLDIEKEKTCCHHYTGYTFQLEATKFLYAPSHRQDSTYHSLCYTSCGTMAGTRNISTHRTMSGRSNMELHLIPKCYI